MSINDIPEKKINDIEKYWDDAKLMMQMSNFNKINNNNINKDKEIICLQYSVIKKYNNNDQSFVYDFNNSIINLNNYKNYLIKEHECDSNCYIELFKKGCKVYNIINDNNTYITCSEDYYVCIKSGNYHLCEKNLNCEYTVYRNNCCYCIISKKEKFQSYSIIPSYDENNKYSYDKIDIIKKNETSNLNKLNLSNEKFLEKKKFITSELIDDTIEEINNNDNNNNNNNIEINNIILNRNIQDINKKYELMSFKELLKLKNLITNLNGLNSYIEIKLIHGIDKYQYFQLLIDKEIIEKLVEKKQQEIDKNYVKSHKESDSFKTSIPNNLKFKKNNTYSSYAKSNERNKIKKESKLKSTTVLNDKNKFKNGIIDLNNINDNNNNNNNNNNNKKKIDQIEHLKENQKINYDSALYVFKIISNQTNLVNSIEEKIPKIIAKIIDNNKSITQTNLIVLTLENISKKYILLDKNRIEYINNDYIINFIKFWEKLIDCEYIKIKFELQKKNRTFFTKSLIYSINSTKKLNIEFDFSLSKKFILDNNLEKDYRIKHSKYENKINLKYFNIIIIKKNEKFNHIININYFKKIIEKENKIMSEKKQISILKKYKQDQKMVIKTKLFNFGKKLYNECLKSIKKSFKEEIKLKIKKYYDNEIILTEYIDSCLNLKFEYENLNNFNK